MKILTEHQVNSLKNYKYHGGDLSLLYKYVLSPFAEFCVVNFTPLTVAPNTITFLGLIASVICSILTLVFNPSLDVRCPKWLAFVTGISILTYQTLDNMDGKQARRTGSSSPLGMLFDHGIDAINTGLLCLSMSSVFGTGWTIKLFLSYYIGFITFYIQTWEEYYTGTMILPILNGPSDGLFLISIFSFVTAFTGSQIWQEPTVSLPRYFSRICDEECQDFLQITRNFDKLYISPFQINVVVGLFWSSTIIITQVFSVLSKLKNYTNALLDLLPMIVHFLSVFIWCSISPIALPHFPILTNLYIYAVFVEIVVHIMLMHVTNDKTQPNKRYLAYMSVFLPLSSYYDKNIEAILIYYLAVTSTIITSIYLYDICNDVSDALGIYILVLGRKKKE